MADHKITAIARVSVVVEIETRSEWESSCTIAQVEKQAAGEALNHLRQVDPRIRVVGEPSVQAVITRRA